MKQNIWFGLRAAMLAAVIGAASSTQAQQGLSTLSAQRHANLQTSSTRKSAVTIAQVSQAQTAKTDLPGEPASAADAVKIGTRLSATDVTQSDAILAKVQAHEWAGRQSATLYVRNIPVLTFLGNPGAKSETVKLGVTAPPASKEAEAESSNFAIATPTGNQKSGSALAPSSEADDPVSSATVVAAQINQLTLSSGTGDITVHWVKQPKSKSTAAGEYEVRVDGQRLVALNHQVVLAGQSRQTETNALQATNRLRRLLANAAPLTAVADKPRQVQAGVQQVALGPVRFSLNGVASWYGPGFHGNLSANGEIYNQYALTAAHKTLPFGTKIRVTNLNNGRAVVVRINDRGPYVGDRIIDLSLGAAEVIGMTGTGVARVQLDILN